jgi:methyl-accepting chemotaxis protein
MTALAASLSTLDQVARLDEPAVAEARRLVSAAPEYDATVKGQKSAYGLEQVGLELKRHCEYWEKCEAAQKALAEVEKPVLEVSRQVSGHRQQAQKQMDAALALLRQPGGWLPVSLPLDAEKRELDSLEKQWRATQEQQISAIQLVARLGDLSSRYQVLAEKIERAAERAAREQADFESLTGEIEEQAERWRSLQRDYRDNPQASQEIRELLDGLAQELDRLKEQSRQGALSAEQVQQALKKLSRRVRLAQVAVDDQHAVDINGRVIESKDSTYREI